MEREGSGEKSRTGSCPTNDEDDDCESNEHVYDLSHFLAAIRYGSRVENDQRPRRP